MHIPNLTKITSSQHLLQVKDVSFPTVHAEQFLKKHWKSCLNVKQGLCNVPAAIPKSQDYNCQLRDHKNETIWNTPT